jgi:hypothetical protein
MPFFDAFAQTVAVEGGRTCLRAGTLRRNFRASRHGVFIQTGVSYLLDKG